MCHIQSSMGQISVLWEKAMMSATLIDFMILPLVGAKLRNIQILYIMTLGKILGIIINLTEEEYLLYLELHVNPYLNKLTVQQNEESH